MLSTKDFVLSELITSDTYVSGERLSTALNISRAAINTAVKSLKAEGYAIESSTRKGYMLTNHPDIVNPGEILALLPEDRLESVIIYDEVDSTNNKLKELGASGAPSGTIVIADCQTKGKGRLGRSFSSPHGTGIYFSYLMRPKTRLNEISSITAWTAVAISNAINNVCGIRPDIKWVNDLLINKRKICGILTEMSVETETGSIDNIVIGIGINVNHKIEDFPEEIREIAGSIAMALGTNVLRAKIIAELIKEMDKLNCNWATSKDYYLEEYRKSCITIGKDVSIRKIHSDDDVTYGRAIDINDDFSIRIEFADGHTENMSSGEVSVRGLYGYT